jgi:hypothetical protein
MNEVSDILAIATRRVKGIDERFRLSSFQRELATGMYAAFLDYGPDDNGKFSCTRIQIHPSEVMRNSREAVVEIVRTRIAAANRELLEFIGDPHCERRVRATGRSGQGL